MTTYAYSGYRWTTDSSGQPNITNSVPVTISVVVPDAITTFTYSVLFSAPDDLAEVEIDTSSFYDIRIDGSGISVDREEIDTFVEYLGFLDWGNGNTSILYDLADFTPVGGNFDVYNDYLFFFGGDPVPVFNSAADANAFADSVTDARPITSGAFAPDQPIDLDSLFGVTITEDDMLTGTLGADVYATGLGNDKVFGRGGNDDLSGGDGNDLLDGGSNNDTLSGDNGNDVLRGGGGNDMLMGGRGNDVLRGGANDDTFVEFTGDDFINGEAGFDVVDYSLLGSALSVDLRTTETQTISAAAGMDRLISIEGVVGGRGGDTLLGSNIGNVIDGFTGNDLVAGLGGDDFVIGGAGNDTLRGNDGNDLLDGGLGRDLLGGGAGADTLFFGALSDSKTGGVLRDRIQDFEQGIDIISLSAIDANSIVGGNQAFLFRDDGRFTGTAGELRFVQTNATQKTIVQVDVDGDRARDFEFEMTGLLALTEADFLL